MKLPTIDEILKETKVRVTPWFAEDKGKARVMTKVYNHLLKNDPIFRYDLARYLEKETAKFLKERVDRTLYGVKPSVSKGKKK